MEICVTNLAEYNAGELIYEWLSLPASEEEIQKIIDLVKVHEDDEIFLSDWNFGEFDELVGEYTNINQLNEWAEKIVELSDSDAQCVKFLIDHMGMSFDEALEKHENVGFYEGCTLKEVAEMLVDDGLYGNIPDSIKNYLDYDAIARDLYYEMTETRAGVFEYNG